METASMASRTVSSSMSTVLSPASSAITAITSAPAQGSLESAGRGIVGGYDGDSLSLKIIIAFFLGMSMYNSLELIILVFVTFRKFEGLYFWSLLIATFGIIPYALGFLIKFYGLLPNGTDLGYVAVVLLTVGWWLMVTGQSVVLWSRLHLVISNKRILRWTLIMIIVDAIVLHIPTTVLTFGSNSNNLSLAELSNFVRGYSIMEKVQMVCFFVQECILSLLYVGETVRLLRLHDAVSDPMKTEEDKGEYKTRKTMYQLIAINVIIMIMDCALLGLEFANLYILETTIKGVFYSIKLKLEFAVLSKLVQLVTSHPSPEPSARRNTALTLEKSHSAEQHYPDFVDPTRLTSDDLTHAAPHEDSLHTVPSRQSHRRRSRAHTRASWLEEEMDKHNIPPVDEG